MDKVDVPSDSLSPLNQTPPFMHVEVGELEISSTDLPSSSPTPHTHNSSASLDYESNFCDEVLSPRPLSFGSFVPMDCELLFSPAFNVSFDIHEDQVLDGVGVKKKT